MCKYKHSLTKIETFYTNALLNRTKLPIYKSTTNIENVDTMLVFLSNCRQFFVSDPKGS